MKSEDKPQTTAINFDKEEELLEVEHLIAPKDKFLFNYFMFLLMGIVLILPFNALIQSLAFLETNLPDRDIEFVVATLTNAPIFLGQILMLFLAKFFNIKLTLVVCMVIMAGLCLSIPFLTENITDVDILWPVILVVISLFWFINGIVQSCGYGFSGVFPQSVVASFNNGTGMSGVVAGGLRAIMLLSFPSEGTVVDDPHLFLSSVLFFGISAGLTILSTIFLVLSFGTEYSKFYANNVAKKENADKINNANNMMRSSQNFTMAVDNRISVARSSIASEDIKPSIIKVHNDNWINLWGILVNFMTVFIIFPGLLLQRPISFIEDVRWMVWFVIMVFSTWGTVGRIIWGFIPLKNTYLWAILTILRSLTVVVAFLSAYDVSFFGSTTVIVINILVASFSFGYLMTCQIIMACTLPEPHEMETAGKLVTIFLQGGILIGSLIATFGVAYLF